MKSRSHSKSTPRGSKADPVVYQDAILLIVIGTTPGVLTETVWALAHEATPVIPNRIVVITTAAGQQILNKELLAECPTGEPPIWDQLRAAIFARHPGATGRLVLDLPGRIITAVDAKRGTTYPLEDIRTPAEQEAAADFLLAEVQNFTKDGDPPLIVSMSGGRKTLGALLYAAMTLQGREEDRLTHVLVPAPYESPLMKPRFYFPEQRPGWHVLTGQDKMQFRSRDARIDLADVPFPRLRYLFGKEYARLPRRFTDIVRAASTKVKTLANVELSLDEKLWIIRIRGKQVQLNGREIPFFHFLCTRLSEGHPPFEFHGAAEGDFKAFLGKWCSSYSLDAARHRISEWKSNVNADDFRKLLNSLRTRFRKAGLSDEAERLFPQRGRLGFACDVVQLLK